MCGCDTNQTAKSASSEGEHVASKRSRADDHDAESTAHAFANLAEHQLVPDRVAADYTPEIQSSRMKNTNLVFDCRG